MKAYADHNEKLVKASEELEYLVKELGQTLIQQRELWELIAALVTLIATVIGTLANIRLSP